MVAPPLLSAWGHLEKEQVEYRVWLPLHQSRFSRSCYVRCSATSGRLHDEDPVQSAVGAVLAVVDVTACPEHVQLMTDQWKWLAKTCSVGDRSVEMAGQDMFIW